MDIHRPTKRATPLNIYIYINTYIYIYIIIYIHICLCSENVLLMMFWVSHKGFQWGQIDNMLILTLVIIFISKLWFVNKAVTIFIYYFDSRYFCDFDRIWFDAIIYLYKMQIEMIYLPNFYRQIFTVICFRNPFFWHLRQRTIPILNQICFGDRHRILGNLFEIWKHHLNQDVCLQSPLNISSNITRYLSRKGLTFEQRKKYQPFV